MTVTSGGVAPALALSRDAAALARLAGRYTHAVVATQVVADAETTVTLARKLGADRPGGFVLESAEGPESVGRYSFVGPPAQEVLEVHDGQYTVHQQGKLLAHGPAAAPLEVLAGWLAERRVAVDPALAPLQAGAVGWIGYELLAALEHVPIPPPTPDDPQVPMLRWLRVESVAVVDHLRRTLRLCVVVPLSGNGAADLAVAARRLAALVTALGTALPAEPPVPMPTPAALAAAVQRLPVRTWLSRPALQDAVAKARLAVQDGECFQIVVSQRFEVASQVAPFALYRALRAVSPAPFLFCLPGEQASAVGASPELLVSVRQRTLLARPIAGTRRRGTDAREDAALARSLRADEKELAEHRMLVDLGRNDLGRVAEPGSVRVRRRERIERFSHVQHLVTDLQATLARKTAPLAAVAACFPAGTVSGAPKLRAAEWIARLEPGRRGLYAGAVGFVDATGQLELCIAIRTAVVEPNRVLVQAGAGIVADSDPVKEADECEAKARAALTALALATWSAPPAAQPEGAEAGTAPQGRLP